MDRIGILTGGGDAPGLNAVIRAATETAILEYGCEVFGIRDGYDGFLAKDVSGILPRGGTPTAFDRWLATRYGAAAVRLATKGGFDRMVALHGGQITDIALGDALAVPRRMDPNEDGVITARGMGISFGDE